MVESWWPVTEYAVTLYRRRAACGLTFEIESSVRLAYGCESARATIRLANAPTINSGVLPARPLLRRLQMTFAWMIAKTLSGRRCLRRGHLG